MIKENTTLILSPSVLTKANQFQVTKTRSAGTAASHTGGIGKHENYQIKSWKNKELKKKTKTHCQGMPSRSRACKPRNESLVPTEFDLCCRHSPPDRADILALPFLAAYTWFRVHYDTHSLTQTTS